jgi:hypothetical protein
VVLDDSLAQIGKHIAKYVRRLLDDARIGYRVDDPVELVLAGVTQGEGK